MFYKFLYPQNCILRTPPSPGQCIASSYSIVWMYCDLLTIFPIDGHSAGFQFSLFKNNAARNIISFNRASTGTLKLGMGAQQDKYAPCILEGDHCSGGGWV